MVRPSVACSVLAVAIAATPLLEAQAAGPIGSRPRRPGVREEQRRPVKAVEEPQTTLLQLVHEDPVVQKAMRYAFSFSDALPDFVCDQRTERFESRDNGAKWKKIDVVDAEVVYVERRENYRNIRLNGRPLRSFDSLDGTTSTGEYGTVLRNMFHPSVEAEFTYLQDDEIVGVPTRVYKVKVDERRSHWRIGFNDQHIEAAYRGRVWIAPENGAVLRIEMEAVRFPLGFGLASSEMAIEYEPIEIGAARPLLPVRSVNMACFTQEVLCRRNDLFFRNYRKFGVEATVDFGEEALDEPDEALDEPPTLKRP